MERTRALLLGLGVVAALVASARAQEPDRACVDQKLDEVRVSVLNTFERITRLRMIRVKEVSFLDRIRTPD